MELAVETLSCFNSGTAIVADPGIRHRQFNADYRRTHLDTELDFNCDHHFGIGSRPLS